MEANHRRFHRQERRAARLKTPGSGTPAEVERRWVHCVKPLGQRLPLTHSANVRPGIARDCNRQIARVQGRVAILNGDMALGIPATKASG